MVPSDVDEGTTANRRHLRWIRSGVSFSGRERNCCFLNLGGGPFADVSFISGLDLPDDARAMGRTDWDHDGDLDFWIGNRTGPQLRYLRNDTPSAGHFLALKLIGRTCNRDAIGARVEVVCAGDTGAPRIQTLAAGDGYLSQSSKWLHFGLGDATGIERVTVRWPSGEREEFLGAEPDGRFQLEQGLGRCVAWQPPVDHVPARQLVPKPLAEPPASDAVHILLAAPVPLPSIAYRDSSGNEARLSTTFERPLLVNLWASWCGPCLMELGELAQHHEQLTGRVDILALSVDGLGDERGSEADAKGLIERLRLPFPTGSATADAVGKLELIEQHLFEPIVPIAIPTSFLINRRGELASIYSGPVSVQVLLADLARLDGDVDELRRASLPFAGRWLERPVPLRLLPILWDLVDGGWLDDGLDLMQARESQLKHDREYAKLLALTGYRLLERGDVERSITQYRAAIDQDPTTIVAHLNLAAAQVRAGRYADAIAQYRAALRYGPRDIRLYNGLAWLLATAEDKSVRDGTEALKLAEQAARVTGYRHQLVLETLAAAQAEAGQFAAAVATSERACQLARDAGDQQAVQRNDQRIELYRQDRAFYEIIPR